MLCSIFFSRGSIFLYKFCLVWTFCNLSLSSSVSIARSIRLGMNSSLSFFTCFWRSVKLALLIYPMTFIDDYLSNLMPGVASDFTGEVLFFYSSSLLDRSLSFWDCSSSFTLNMAWSAINFMSKIECLLPSILLVRSRLCD